MSETAPDPTLDQPAKKRKRSGKERQQRKAEAIAAAAAAAEAEATGTTLENAAADSEVRPNEDSVEDVQLKESAVAGEMDVEQEDAIEEEGEVEPVAEVFDLEKVQGRIASIDCGPPTFRERLLISLEPVATRTKVDVARP